MRKHKRVSLLQGRGSLPIKIGIGVVVLLVLLVLFIPSDTKENALSSSAVKRVRERGTLLVGVNDDIYGFSDGETGLETEIARRIAEEIFSDSDAANSVTFVNMSQSFMDMHFGDGSIDIAIMQCPNDFYESKYAYSETYYTDRCLMVIKRTSEASGSLNNAKIGVVADTISVTRLDSYVSDADISVNKQEYPTYDLMLNALKAERIDACVLPGIYFDKYQSTYAIKVHNASLDNIGYSVACNTEDSAFADIASAVINDMKKSGELSKLTEDYIGG